MHELGVFPVSRGLQLRWKQGNVAPRWARRYPQLFDADDLRLAMSQGHMGYHFFEWFAAIILHHATGYHALVAKYQFGNHSRKETILQKLLSPRMLEALRDRESFGSAQAPDLLMYAADFLNYFFCEVKGPADRLSQVQALKFEALTAVEGAKVCLFKFKWTNSGGKGPSPWHSHGPHSAPKNIRHALMKLAGGTPTLPIEHKSKP
jgi:hypothetical protein